jgi:putative FmdB family regulatory protein
MPIYEFVCESCGHEFEQILAFSATKVPSCPACQSEQVHRQMSRPAIHFKGSGWYINDSKVASKVSANGPDKEKSGASEENKGESSPSEKSGGGSETSESKSSESKSEVKAASQSESTKASAD